MLSRKDLFRASLFASLGSVIPAASAGALGLAEAAQAAEITLDDLRAAEKIAGISFTDDERKALLNDVKQQVKLFEGVRAQLGAAQVTPGIHFATIAGGTIPGSKSRVQTSASKTPALNSLTEEDIAFLSTREQGKLIRDRKITSVELTRIYLNRLKLYGPKLECVVTLTEELALTQAKQADDEIAKGKYRGPLHGIPYGIKDLFATKGIKTSWGAAPYQNQVLDYDAVVVQKLREAGAVLCAKLTLGALALGDVWYGGVTKNPWNLKQGSSGSSAGSCAATAAGLVSFAIGTETLGSICSPSLRCRTTGLRPTFGRVSRTGAMELAYTMDKVGPICREVEDCALVFASIIGADAGDPATVDRPFNYRPLKDLKGIKIGYTSDLKPEDPFLKNLAELGATIRPVKFAAYDPGLLTILDVECGSAFDELTRSPRLNDLKNSPWPATFRASRYVPAVEYLQAQRIRANLMRTFEAEFGDLDAFVGNGIGQTIVHVNLTGHPQIMIPQGDDGKGNSLGKCIIGRLFKEDRLLQIAKLAQEATDFHRKRPTL
jgi:Asp-tRNA(Asn)/Glu-tRNA(Gln) amidotransferase A subunit family amidase